MRLIDPRKKQSAKAQLGSLTIDVISTPRDKARAQGGLFAGIRFVFKSLKSLLNGMKVTLGYLVRPSTVVTQQYPENRETLKMFERFRGQLRLKDGDNGYMNCNGCNICETACPNGSIIIKDRRNHVYGKSELDRFIWRLDTCTFCNACVQACPHDALFWTQDFESSVFDRRLLVYTLNDYAGPPSKIIARAEKKGEMVDELKATYQPRGRYAGPVPLSGVAMPGIPALGAPRESSGEGVSEIGEPPQPKESE